MNKFKFKFLFSLMALMPAMADAADVKIKVVNDQKTQRQELIEVSVDDVRRKLGLAEDETFVVKNAVRQQVDYQITHDGKLLIDAAVKPCGTTVFTVSKGIPEPMRQWVEGKCYPIRKDDIAWENDRTAYRLYGPALQKTGERSFGIDVWTKNSPDMNLSHRYYLDHEGNVRGYEIGKNGRKDDYIDLHTTFHLDHGQGLDCYGVGPSLGCGTPALMDGDNLIFPYCYKTYRILDNGPLRFTVELTYNPAKIKDDENVVEHRIISLDKGSNFNRVTVWYTGLTKPCDLASGVVVHSADKESVVIGKNYVQYADPTDRPDSHGFQLYVAALFPNGAKCRKLFYDKPEGGIEGHAVGVVKGLTDNQRYTYYFGSAWSCYDVRNQDEWQLRVDGFMNALDAPLEVTVE